jgi:hypothetical protein
MNSFNPNVTPGRRASRAHVNVAQAIAFAALVGPAGCAHAADGCLVLLCLAAPSWRNIPQCVEPVRQVLRDLARGRPFPSCSMSDAGNSASNQWSSAPGFCPPQYTRSVELESGTVYTCDYSGAIAVNVNGALWSRTWWSLSGGDTVTEFTPTAKAQLGSWDARFEDDYAAWLASLPPAPTACTWC